MEQQAVQVLSLRLFRVLEDIGVNKYMIARRRRTWLMTETMKTICSTLKGENGTFYHYGSQSEGTTTTGMQSDIDTLFCYNDFPVILDWGGWQQGKLHFLAVKTEQSPPQHCRLQWLRPDLPLPLTQVELPSDLVDSEGRVLHTNTQVEHYESIRELNPSGEVVQHGPSRSWDEDDVVMAYHCASLPEECQFLFQRPRPGHWPKPDTLAKARRTGVFLVPQGYSESPSRPTKWHSTALHVNTDDSYYPQSRWEWRFSTSMMERLLVFDMNIMQLKTYVFIKILRKTFLKPVVGDRLSTFHIKTSMLYTIETYPPAIWREDNLVQCVIYCLTTLSRWLNIKYCPHYTIAGVNLFTGKLFQHELPSMSAIISSLMDPNMSYISQIDMDFLGVNMLHISRGLTDERNKRKKTHQLILSYLSQWYIVYVVTMHQDIMKKFIVNTWEQSTLQQISQHGTDLEQEAAKVIMPLCYGLLASSLASRCIHLGQPITWNILNLYQLSFDSDQLSSRLKFASMLYCSGQYEAAANCLTFCEGLLGPDIWNCCCCPGRVDNIPNNQFLDKLEHSSNKNMLQKYTALCVSFRPQEMCCVPEFLVYEMFKTVGDEDRQQRQPASHYEWMDKAVMDCVPFLHYLQYLTYRQLNIHHRKQVAMRKLLHYTGVDSKGCDHIDTALNMLGHCNELENRQDLAWICYTASLKRYRRNNAAIWHVAILVHQHINN